MTVGQAHLLDDLISLVRRPTDTTTTSTMTALMMTQIELSPATGPSLLAQMTFTYALGVEHGLYAGLAGVTEATEAEREEGLKRKRDDE